MFSGHVMCGGVISEKIVQHYACLSTLAFPICDVNFISVIFQEGKAFANLPTHFAFLFLCVHIPFFFPAQVLVSGPLTVNPSGHNRVQFVPWGTFCSVQSPNS